jgi:peptide/nickel transport system permease protein
MVLQFAKRIAFLIVVVWAAATVNFFIPRAVDRNPIVERLSQLAAQGGGSLAGIQDMVRSYEERFGLDRPLWRQYLSYLADVSRLDLGYSISNYPMRVADQIAFALPWTIGLLGTATLIAFTIGTGLGALAGSRRGPRAAKVILPAFVLLSAIPFYLVGLLLVYFVGFRWNLLPTGGGYSLGSIPALTTAHVADVALHSLLPAASIVAASIGFWALGMRGMMVTTEGEDYMTFAEAKGLSPTRIFLAYGVRNAILPQATTLALAFGKVVTGAILVEMVFGYPGIGNLLFEAIKLSDFFTIYGCVLVLVLTVAVSMSLVEAIYPILDPRTRVKRA